jgi:hypothetical protein
VSLVRKLSIRERRVSSPPVGDDADGERTYDARDDSDDDGPGDAAVNATVEGGDSDLSSENVGAVRKESKKDQSRA